MRTFFSKKFAQQTFLEAGPSVLSVLVFLTSLSAVVGYALSNHVIFTALQAQVSWAKAAQGLSYELALNTGFKLLPLFVVFTVAALFFFYQYSWFKIYHGVASATTYFFYG